MKKENSKIDSDVFSNQVTVTTQHTYFAVIGVLLLLLLFSIYTSGFGIIKQSSYTNSNNPASSSPQPTPSGGILIDSLVDNDPSKGSSDAQIIIVEFSDFECPYCGDFFADTLPQLENEYINTGKVKLVYRDYPLTTIHPQAQKAAEAAECANEQGKFWQYHNVVFQNQQSLSVSSLKQFASSLGLDTIKFNECLDSGKYAGEVQKDSQDGSSVGVRGTPSFFIGKKGGSAIFVSGARDYSFFKQAIDSLN